MRFAKLKTLFNTHALKSRPISCSLKHLNTKDGNKNYRSDKEVKDINSLIQPLSVKPYNDPDGINVGDELAGNIPKGIFLCIDK